MKLENLKKIEGKQTVESIMEKLGIERQSAINLVSKLKKDGFAEKSGGGRQKRIYSISSKRIFQKRNPGMFDFLNKYAKDKVNPLFEHNPHSKYSVENAVCDLIELDDFRIMINVLPLFNHIKNWPLLYRVAKKKNIIRKVGALYDVAKQTTRIRKMPSSFMKYFLNSAKSKKEKDFLRSSGNFSDVEKKWKIKIPFNKKDLKAYR